MGLPIFVAPAESDVAVKAVEKATTAARSSIRRQRTLRGPQARALADNRRRRVIGIVGEPTPGDYEVWENTSRSPPNGTSNEPDSLSTAELHARAHRMFEEERIRLRDAVPRLPMIIGPSASEIDGPLMPPVPESRDYSSFEERRQQIQRMHDVRRDLRRIARRRPAPTPPYTDTDLAFIARVGIDSPRLSLTPTLSPSHRAEGENSRSSVYPGPFTQEEIESGLRDPSFMTDPPPARSALSERVQFLNRASNNMERSRRLMRQARLDGLGDRDRSLSPENGAAWDTLLTSITPDPQPPSASSSFASTSASASASAAAAASSNSGHLSAHTSMTSLHAMVDSPTLRDCDVPDSDSDNEDDMYEIRDNDHWWRSYADVVNAGNQVDTVAVRDTEHLGGMQRIISRLAEREDIPDEWWAGAGLRREPTT